MDLKKDTDIYYQEGRSAKQDREFKRALVHFTRAIRLDRNNWKYFFECGLCLAKQQEYNKALSLYKKALIINPQSSAIYFNLACVLELFGKFDESIEMYQQSIHFDPDDADPYYNLAIILTRKEKYEEAQEHFAKALKLDVSLDFKIYNCFGYLYFLQGEFTKAISELQKAIASKSKNTWAYFNLSLVLFCENRDGEAEDVFDVGLKTLEEDENKTKIIKGIIENYSGEKARLETKLNENKEIMNEENIKLLQTLINGLARLINLFSQHRDPKKEWKF